MRAIDKFATGNCLYHTVVLLVTREPESSSLINVLMYSIYYFITNKIPRIQLKDINRHDMVRRDKRSDQWP